MSIQERKDREKEQRKSTILDAAEAIFKEKGFEKTTIDEIAHKAELAKGTLYIYFTSKEEIYGGIILRGLEKIALLYETELRKAVTGLEKFKLIGNIFNKFCKNHSDYLKAMAMYQSPQFIDFVQQNGPIIKEIESRKKKNTEGLIQILQQGIQDGSVDKNIDIIKTAHITMMTTAMFATSPLKEIPPQQTEELLQYYFELLARSIQAR